MAIFKRLTIEGTTEKILINLETVRWLQPFKNYTVVRFSEDHAISVTEMPDEILMDQPGGRRSSK